MKFFPLSRPLLLLSSLLLLPLEVFIVTRINVTTEFMIDNCRAQVWLQEFGWTEEETAAKIGKRGGACGPVHDALKNEPMFCFGTAVKLFYWSHLVYDMNEEGSRRFSIETALGLFGLDKYELMWEKAEDTKVSNLNLCHTLDNMRIVATLSYASCVVH